MIQLKEEFNLKKEIIYGWIYLFTVSGKGYVGQTPYLKHRFNFHFYEKRNPYFHNSLKKYFSDPESSFKILECWKRNGRNLVEFRKLLNSREIFWIEKLDTFDPEQKRGWNLTKGGGGTLGRTPTEKERNNQSQKMSGKNNPNWGNHLSNGRQGENHPLWGKHHKKETREKMSISHQGKKHPNAKLTEEQVKEIRSSNLKLEELGKIYSLNQATISKIKLGKLWRHIK